MSFDQYHEPPQELSEKTRAFARMILSSRFRQRINGNT